MFKLYGVLGAITSCNLKFGQIKILLYSYQINKYLQKLIGAFHISIMQDVQILFKCLLLSLILPFYWYPLGRLRKQKTSLTYPWSKMSAWWPEGWNNDLNVKAKNHRAAELKHENWHEHRQLLEALYYCLIQQPFVENLVFLVRKQLCVSNLAFAFIINSIPVIFTKLSNITCIYP